MLFRPGFSRINHIKQLLNSAAARFIWLLGFGRSTVAKIADITNIASGGRDMDELMLDFEQDEDFDVIQAQVLPFLKDRCIVTGDTVHCTIHPCRVDDEVNKRLPFWLGDTVEKLADAIAESLAGYAKGKDGLLYSSMTISVR